MASAAPPQLSKKSAGVRRLLQEAAELANDECSDYQAAPLEDDLFTWHFTIRGPGGDFEGGVYHGKMVLPVEYPFKPPAIYLLTPSGRFETNKPICLSISSFHPESWQPSWGVRTALVALMAFFDTSGAKGAVGSLDAPPAERRRLARCSRNFQCQACGFDSADPTAFPSAVVIPEAPVEEEAVEEPGPSSPATAIFPTPRNPPRPVLPPATHSHSLDQMGGGINAGNGGNLPGVEAVGGMGVGVGAGNIAPAPQLPVIHRPPEPITTMTTTAYDQGGGPPTFIDRAILVVLLAILAMVVRKIA